MRATNTATWITIRLNLRQLDDRRTALQNAPFQISKYSDNVVRQMISTIRVMDGNRLLITFKGGYEAAQAMNE